MNRSTAVYSASQVRALDAYEIRHRNVPGYTLMTRAAEAALKLLRARWSDVLANDPLYSPFLNLDPYPYSALAWPPRPAAPRLNTVAAAPTASLAVT